MKMFFAGCVALAVLDLMLFAVGAGNLGLLFAAFFTYEAAVTLHKINQGRSSATTLSERGEGKERFSPRF